MYSISQANSYADDSSYDIATDNIDGDSESEASTQELTVKAAKRHKAKGAAGTQTKRTK